MKLICRKSLVVLLLVMASTVTSGQPTELKITFESRPGTFLSLESVSIIRHVEDSIVVSSESRILTIAFSQIRVITWRNDDSTFASRLAIIGGAAGFVAGGALGYISNQSDHKSGVEEKDAVISTLQYGVLGGVVGALGTSLVVNMLDKHSERFLPTSAEEARSILQRYALESVDSPHQRTD